MNAPLIAASPTVTRRISPIEPIPPRLIRAHIKEVSCTR